jgi:hypothetical protein
MRNFGNNELKKRFFTKNYQICPRAGKNPFLAKTVQISLIHPEMKNSFLCFNIF